ncbi:hypothetical protein, partial [Pseudomonas viridiflava]|uniref:hypothetical protein n=1 Tax=Pseudomonas viridiflava TaxID=33069 RepID=UPI0019D25695
QVRSYQTTCKPLKKLDFVGADLSAKGSTSDAYAVAEILHSRTSGTPPGPLPPSLLRDSATSKTW